MSKQTYKSGCSDSDFIRVWLESKSSYEVAKKLGIARRNVMYRRRRLEKKYGPLPAYENNNPIQLPDTTERISIAKPYKVVIFSDAHWWPNVPSPATSILIQIIQHVKPQIVIANGDVVDGAQISRHGRIGWDQRPTIKEEIETAQTHMRDIEKACRAKRYLVHGNHDLRFDTYLAEHAAPFEGVKGTSLDSFFPKWLPTWAINLNDTCIVKHRWHGGVHAAYSNVLKGGLSIVTGHTHRLNIRPFSDYRGTRFGIEGGTMADPLGPQFDYTEANPKDWQQGFVILHIDGQDLHCEAVHVNGNRAHWGGQVWTA